METVLSGIRSTGNLHLGNYMGAVRNFVRLQDDYRCFFFIADYHSLTTHPTPEDLHGNVRKVLAEYLASGIDPEKSVLYVQSEVPEVIELYLLLNMNAYLGELERTVTFKEKVRKNPDNVNAGLLTYPVLMAADILVHRANKVPVGKDQEQHLELARIFARRFNHMYGEKVFPEPEAFNFGRELVKVPGLDGTGKMGKSEGSGLFLVDDPKVIRKKVMSAVTDAGPTAPNQTPSEPVQNLFTILKLVGTPDKVEFFTDAYNNCSIRYGDLKKEIAEDIVALTTPIRERILDIENDSASLHRVLEMGAERARARAGKTLADVREIMGITKF